MAAEAEDDDYPELRPGGTSKSWLSALANHKNIFNEFLKSLTGELKAGAGQDFDKVDMEILSATKIWGQCGHYLCHDYKITKAGKDKGKSLDEATAIPIFSSLLNMAKRRSATCVLSDEHKVCCLPACARAPARHGGPLARPGVTVAVESVTPDEDWGRHRRLGGGVGHDPPQRVRERGPD